MYDAPRLLEDDALGPVEHVKGLGELRHGVGGGAAQMEGALAVRPRVVVAPLQRHRFRQVGRRVTVGGRGEGARVADDGVARASVGEEAGDEDVVAPLVKVGGPADRLERVVRRIEVVVQEGCAERAGTTAAFLMSLSSHSGAELACHASSGAESTSGTGYARTRHAHAAHARAARARAWRWCVAACGTGAASRRRRALSAIILSKWYSSLRRRDSVRSWKTPTNAM
jgi:hypothetical protein